MLKKNFLIKCFFVLSAVFVFFHSSLAQTNSSSQIGDEIWNLPVESKLKGEHLKCIEIAFEAFKISTDIPDVKKKIENYEISVRQNKDNFFILFFANRTEDEIYSFGGESSLGVDVLYIIDRKDYKIIKRLKFK